MLCATPGGALVVNGKPFDVAPYGIAIAAERKQLAELMQDALKSLMEDGTYQQILDDWGIAEGAITDPRILTRKNIPEPTPLYSTQEPTPTPSL